MSRKAPDVLREMKKWPPEQKIAMAKKLLFMATREIRSTERLARAADRCACGHRRDEHTVSYSINYTEGYCMACPDNRRGHSTCQWFNYQPALTSLSTGGK